MMGVLRDMLADWLLFWFMRLTEDTDELQMAYDLMLCRKERYEREDAARKMQRQK